MVILCIIIVKNINNLLLELGPVATTAFFIDLKRDLLENTKGRNESSQKAGSAKRQRAIEIIDSFCNATISDTSSVYSGASLASGS